MKSKQIETAEVTVVPAKFCVKIGRRNRYFASKAEALDALEKFNIKCTISKLARARRMTRGEVEAKDRRYEVYAVIAAYEGHTGKSAAMAANFYDEICKAPGAFESAAKYAAALQGGKEGLEPFADMKEKQKFTDSFIASLKPKTSKYYLREADGFAVRVMPTGLKTWFFICTVNGKRTHINLGHFPKISLDVARDRYLLQKVNYKRLQKMPDTL